MEQRSPDEGIPEGEAPDVNPDEARQGEKLGVMRYVLAISTVLAALGMAIAAYFIVG